MPSWNWPFARKDMEIYGATGYVVTVASDNLRVGYQGEKIETQRTARPLPDNQKDSLSYLAAVLRGQIKPQGDLRSRYQHDGHANPRRRTHLCANRTDCRTQTTAPMTVQINVALWGPHT
jgi:hypothetical protein